MLGRKKYQWREPGFSMIEMMFAVVILAIGLLAVIQLQVSSVNSLAEARHRTVALEIAERKMEVLKTFRYVVDQPTVAPLDADSNPIVDATGNSVFYDAITALPGGGMQGNGEATLHWDLPVYEQVDKDGNLVTRAGSTRVGGMTFFVLWTIERGGSKGTPWPAGLTAPTYFGKVCTVYTPGPNQMRIRVIVTWFEPRDRARSGKSHDDFYNDHLSSTLPGLPNKYDTTHPRLADPIGKVFEQFPNRVVLECVRDQVY